MQVAVSLLPGMREASAETDVAVVIDVLRATTGMTAALAEGAEQVITCEGVDQARRLAEQSSPRPLLCGERGCQPIEGFDLGNSPGEYVRDTVGGRSLILTTTNGTRAIAAAAGAKEVVVASFLNLTAVVRRLMGRQRVLLVCAGTEGTVTAEDVLLAGALAAFCHDSYRAEFDGDEAFLAEQYWRHAFIEAAVPAADALADRLGQSAGGRNLPAAGYESDLKRCAVIDWTDVVPSRRGDDPPSFTAGS